MKKQMGEHLALYRKYRPSAFSEVLGQEHITQVLEGALAQETISHAYLFSGSRGTGKTTVARIFAKESGTSDKDLYEIDAASNRGIDDIRELREGVMVLPFESKRKVYIIDEVHMLTKEAFNALLKTLEEPPSHAVFILATTEIDKLPETIVSRCESYTFRKPSLPLLKEMIQSTAKKEGYTLEPSSADLIAILADGSFRDAHGILQKIVIASSDKKVSPEEVERVTGAPRSELLNRVIQAIDISELGSALVVVKEAVAQNVDVRIFLTLLLGRMRSILLLKYAPDLKETISEQYTDKDFSFLEGISQKPESAINSKALYELLRAYDQIGHASVPELPLELALISIIRKEVTTA